MYGCFTYVHYHISRTHIHHFLYTCTLFHTHAPWRWIEFCVLFINLFWTHIFCVLFINLFTDSPLSSTRPARSVIWNINGGVSSFCTFVHNDVHVDIIHLNVHVDNTLYVHVDNFCIFMCSNSLKHDEEWCQNKDNTYVKVHVELTKR